MTLANIRKYNMKLGEMMYIGSQDFYPINCALDDLYVIDQKLVCAQDFKERKKYKNIYSYSIERNEDFQNFIKKFSFRRSDLTNVAMKLIWVISTQF